MENISKYEFSLSEYSKQEEFCALAQTVLFNRYNTPKAYVHSFGCQGNVSDGERIKGILKKIGYSITEIIEEADLILFNTCAVREHAQDRVFGNVGALKQLKTSNKNLKIALCGCMVQQEHVVNKIKKSYPFVDIVFGTHVLHRIPEFIYKSISTDKKVYEIPDSQGVIDEMSPISRDSTFKAFVPIMYGCNNFCTYCIVPYVRGRERSRRPDNILEEIKDLISKGYKEITLLGQNVNSYGKDPDYGYNFSRLLREINSIEGDFIIRFMTSHPKDCTEELLDTMANCDKVAKHLHLPVQSGNNNILKKMNRGYTREKYLSLLNYAYKVMPNLSVTTDIIVGFPGETHEEFLDTVTLVEQANYTSMFEFIYSPRNGTVAAKLDDPVSREDKGIWFKELQDVQEKIASSRTDSMEGKVFRVLCEGKNKNGIMEGRTEGNIIIEFDADDNTIGTFQNVLVKESLTWILKGELV